MKYTVLIEKSPDMGWCKFFCILMLCAMLLGCGSKNVQTDSQQEGTAINGPVCLEIEMDSTQYENDSTIYDARLQEHPFTTDALELFEKNADSISSRKIQVYDRTYLLKKVCYHDSYLLFAENAEYGTSLLEAVISDTLMPLSNHIRVGHDRKKLETYYHRSIKQDVIRFVDESEFTEVKIYMKQDVIRKIIFVCYECENELGLY